LLIFAHRSFVEEIETFVASGNCKTSEIELNKLGFQDFFSELIRKYLQPLFLQLFPEYKQYCFDTGHYSFVIRTLFGIESEWELWKYVDEDGNLTSSHYDDSDITVNFCMGENFTGSSLGFFGEKQNNNPTCVVIPQKPGTDLIHLGENKHEVYAITSGRRYNIILWCRKSREAS